MDKGRRSRADEAPVRVRIPRGVTEKTKLVGIFLADNPFFTRDEIIAQLGADIEKTLNAMAADNRVKQVGTHVFCDPLIDATNREVEALMLFTGSSRITAERMAKRATKGLKRREKQIERPGTSLEVQIRNWMRTNKVFTRADVRRKFGVNPNQAIATLQKNREITGIFNGTHVVTTVLPNRRYQVYRDYVHAKSEKQSAAIRAIDKSQMRVCRGPFIPPPVVRSIDDEYKPWLGRKTIRKLPNGAKMPARIWINFDNLETIYAFAGGENKTMPLWRPKKGSLLTDDAAAIIAAHIFPSDMTFGELCALAKGIREKSAKTPGFRPGGRFDHRSRYGEFPRGRYMAHRQGKGFTMPAQCTLTVDHREDPRIIEAFHGIGNLDVDVAVLETGDYRFQWGPDETAQMIVVERKAGEDFGSSMTNGTLKSQIPRLCELPCQTYLITEGRIYEDDGSLRGDTNDREKVKWMSSIGMKMPVMSTPNWQRTVDMLLLLARRAMLASGVVDLQPVEPDPKTHPCGNREDIAAGSQDGPSSE